MMDVKAMENRGRIALGKKNVIVIRYHVLAAPQILPVLIMIMEDMIVEIGVIVEVIVKQEVSTRLNGGKQNVRR